MADLDVNVVLSRPGSRTKNNTWPIPSIKSSLLAVYFIISLMMNGRWKPFVRRGFFCGDTSIVYPSKPDTITLGALLFVSLVVPSIVIYICDNKLNRLLAGSYKSETNISKFSPRKRRKISDDFEPEQESLMPSSSVGDQDGNTSISENMDSAEAINSHPAKIPESKIITDAIPEEKSNGSKDNEKNSFVPVPLEDVNDYNCKSTTSKAAGSLANKFFQRSYSDFQLFIFGLTTTMFLTGLGKLTTGRLRPNFMARCQPNIDCSVPSNKYRYIEDFNCSDKLDTHGYVYITTSWPSGHASSIFYSMLYLAFYLNTVIPVIVNLSSNKLKRMYDPLLLYTVHVMMIALAMYIASTRVSDYHHHPTDVISGSILGLISAFVLARFYLVGRYS